MDAINEVDRVVSLHAFARAKHTTRHTVVLLFEIGKCCEFGGKDIWSNNAAVSLWQAMFKVIHANIIVRVIKDTS